LTTRSSPTTSTPRSRSRRCIGGVQRVYLGNLKTGQHEIVATFTGKGPHQRDYKRGANVKFEKTTEAKYIELRIQDSTGKLQPEFDVKALAVTDDATSPAYRFASAVLPLRRLGSLARRRCSRHLAVQR
jgi:hypothetical protein